VPEKLTLQKKQSGKSSHTFVVVPSESRALVTSEIYTPQWVLSYNGQKTVSLPVNLFVNGFLATFRNSASVTVAYTSSVARWIGVMITLATVVITLVALKKRI